LRIAGQRIDVDLAVDTFTRLDTTEKVESAYQQNEGGFRDEFSSLSRLDKTELIPAKEGKIQCGLVRGITGLPNGLSSRGHVIYVPGFGVIRLAEFCIEKAARELTMLHIELGSTPKGCVKAAHVRGNGSGW
jgi:hypothetical protein